MTVVHFKIAICGRHRRSGAGSRRLSSLLEKDRELQEAYCAQEENQNGKGYELLRNALSEDADEPSGEARHKWSNTR